MKSLVQAEQEKERQAQPWPISFMDSWDQTSVSGGTVYVNNIKRNKKKEKTATVHYFQLVKNRQGDGFLTS